MGRAALGGTLLRLSLLWVSIHGPTSARVGAGPGDAWQGLAGWLWLLFARHRRRRRVSALCRSTTSRRVAPHSHPVQALLLPSPPLARPPARPSRTARASALSPVTPPVVTSQCVLLSRGVCVVVVRPQ